MSIFRLADDASIRIRTFGVTFRNGQKVPPHQMAPPAAGIWHQLVCAIRGVITVRTGQCAWVVPPHRAVWMPAGFQYHLEMSGVVAVRMLYIRPGRHGDKSLPRNCSVVNLTPLLRELILRTVQLGALDAGIPEQKRLIGVILDELKVLIAVPLQLPLPRDSRAAQFAALANRDSGGVRPMETLLRQSGASRRTMERLFRGNRHESGPMAAPPDVTARVAPAGRGRERERRRGGTGIQQPQRLHCHVPPGIGTDAQTLLRSLIHSAFPSLGKCCNKTEPAFLSRFRRQAPSLSITWMALDSGARRIQSCSTASFADAGFLWYDHGCSKSAEHHARSVARILST